MDDAVARADVLIVVVSRMPSAPEEDAEKDGGRCHMSSLETIKEYAKLGRTDHCANEIERAIFLGKLIIPVYYLRDALKYGGSWMKNQLKLLPRLIEINWIKSFQKRMRII